MAAAVAAAAAAAAAANIQLFVTLFFRSLLPLLAKIFVSLKTPQQKLFLASIQCFLLLPLLAEIVFVEVFLAKI